MATFHPGRHELHGVTVVVDTHGTEVWVGRCDDLDERGVILLDADVHREGEGGSRQEYLEKASRFGVWKTVERVLIPADRIASVRRLGEL